MLPIEKFTSDGSHLFVDQADDHAVVHLSYDCDHTQRADRCFLELDEAAEVAVALLRIVAERLPREARSAVEVSVNRASRIIGASLQLHPQP